MVKLLNKKKLRNLVQNYCQLEREKTRTRIGETVGMGEQKIDKYGGINVEAEQYFISPCETAPRADEDCNCIRILDIAPESNLHMAPQPIDNIEKGEKCIN